MGKMLGLWCSDAEYLKITKAADDAGMSASAFGRRAALFRADLLRSPAAKHQQWYQETTAADEEALL